MTKKKMKAASFLSKIVDEPLPTGNERIISPNGVDVTMEAIILRLSMDIVGYQDGNDRNEAMWRLVETLAYAECVCDKETFDSFSKVLGQDASAIIEKAISML